MITVSISGRTYGFHLPNGINPSSPAPVVVVLHALGINGAQMEAATGFSNLADKEGFIAVYPEGTEQPNPGIAGFPLKLPMWNSGALFNISGVDDVTFIKSVLSDLATKANTNPNRTYVVGMSNGAMMAYRLASELSGHFAALAAVAGTITSNPWKPTARRMPVLHIHGTNDGVVSYNAAEWHKSVEDVMTLCASFNGCNITPSKGPPVPASDPYPVEKWDYGVGASGSQVIFYRVIGGGHTWPQQVAVPGIPTGLGPISRSMNATRCIWDFISNY